MQLTVLGSGTNVHPSRAAAGYLVETDQILLLDFGPRTLNNLIQYRAVDRHSLRYVLFSHFHVDHFADFIPFFFDATYHAKYVAPRPDLTIIGPPGTEHLFGTLLKTIPGFDAAPFRVTLREVTDGPLELGDTRIIPRTVVHSDRLHCLGYRIEHAGRALAYSGDAQYCNPLLDLCREANCALLDCSFSATHPGRSHMHAGQCGQVARQAGVDQLVLTHIYPDSERADLQGEAAETFRGPITLAADLLTLAV